MTDSRIDPKTFGAELTMRVDRTLKLPTDTSAEVTSEGLLGGKYVSLVPGGGGKSCRTMAQDHGDAGLGQP